MRLFAVALTCILVHAHATLGDDEHVDLDMGINARYAACQKGDSKVYKLDLDRARCLETCAPSRLVYTQDALEAPFMHESVCTHLGYTKYYTTTASHYVSLVLDFDVYLV
jgi:hypothetical protein